jgi:hypothetical protein
MVEQRELVLTSDVASFAHQLWRALDDSDHPSASCLTSDATVPGSEI